MLKSHYNPLPLATFFLLFHYFLIIPKALEAQINIPIVGADEELSQYTCVTTPGVSTAGIKIILANGQVKDTSVKAAKAQIAKQINGLTKKILSTSALAAQAETKKQRDKLKAKVKTLRTQRENIKYIKTQLDLCEKAELQFNVTTTPVLLTNTVMNPAFQYPLNHFVFGFKFTVPKVYTGTYYCVKVTNATTVPPNLGGTIFGEDSERRVEIFRNCQEAGDPIGKLCVNGLEDDEAMISLTGGAVVEREGLGNCSSASTCPLNELRTLLSNHYANTRLASFRPGGC